GYQRYDPFHGGMVTPPALKTFAKYFVAPALDGWVRILGQPESDLLLMLSEKMPLIHAWLNDSDSGVDIYVNGEHHAERLSDYLRPNGILPDASATYPDNVSPGNSTAGIALPDDVQRLAQTHNVNPGQSNKLVKRLTSQLFGKLDRSSSGEAS